MGCFNLLDFLDVVESMGYSDVLTGGTQMAEDWYNDGLTYAQIAYELESRGMLEYADDC